MTKKISSKKNSERRLKPEDFDEIDEFAAQRERVSLDNFKIDSNEEYVDFDEEAILNVPDSKDFDDSEDFEEDFNDEKSRKILKKEKNVYDGLRNEIANAYKALFDLIYKPIHKHINMFLYIYL